MLFRTLIPAIALLLPFVAAAQVDPFAGGGKEPVTVSLVAEQKGIVPGKPFHAAVRIQHESPWHTYWINPGGVGKATEVTWKLPEGFTAGPLTWPVPHLTPFELGPSHTFDGDLYIVAEIIPPASLKAGATVKLLAEVSWLRCEDAGLCVEGKGSPELSLPVAEAPAPDPESAAGIKAVLDAQPAANAAWKVSLTSSGTNWIVRAEPGEGAIADPGKIHLFDAAKVIVTDEQTWKKDGAAYVLEIGKQDEDSKDEPGGYLYASNGWVTNGKVSVIPAGVAPAGTLATTAAGGPVAVPATVEEQIATIRSWGVRPLGAGNDAGPAAALTWPLALLFAFLGGMILNLMPCVFPVLGIKILGFVRQSGEDAAKVKKHGLVYAAGVIASVLALTAVLLGIRAVGESAGWGFQLQNPVFLASLIILVFALSLGIAGVFELFPNLTSVGAELQDKAGYKGSFFSGLLTVLLATPCTGPFMGPALGFALSADTSMLLVVAIFTTLAVGLALPYVLLSYFPALVKKLPRPGAWMETFKQFMSFPMFATAVWLVTVFVGSTGEGSLMLILFSLIFIAMALWLYGRFGNPGARPKSKRIALPLAVICAGSGLWMALKAARIEAPPATFSAETIIERRAKGLTTVVDFWAKWCLQCELNKEAAFDREAFTSALPKYNAVLLVGDKTKPNPTVDKFLEAYKQGGIPYALVIPPKGPAIELPSVIASPQTLIDALEEAKKQAK